MSERWAKQLRKDAVALGLFREIRGTGPVQNLEIAIPASGTLMRDDEPETEQPEGEPQFTPMPVEQAECGESEPQFTGKGEPQFPPIAAKGEPQFPPVPEPGTTVHAGVNHSSPHREPQFTQYKEITKEIIKETEAEPVVFRDDWPEPEYDEHDEYTYAAESESRFHSAPVTGYRAKRPLTEW